MAKKKLDVGLAVKWKLKGLSSSVAFVVSEFKVQATETSYSS